MVIRNLIDCLVLWSCIISAGLIIIHSVESERLSGLKAFYAISDNHLVTYVLSWSTATEKDRALTHTKLY